MNIYTKKGDQGITSTLTGEKVSKASLQIELQGGVDEVNSQIGYLRSLIHKGEAKTKGLQEKKSMDKELKQIQFCLFQMGSHISSGFILPYITDAEVTALEKSIDSMNERTGDLKSFIYLSGHETGSYAHVIRSTTRRIERIFVRYMNELKLEQQPTDYIYMNRLADYFFQLARYLNKVFGTDEEIIDIMNK